jgi:hypothetical protein
MKVRSWKNGLGKTFNHCRLPAWSIHIVICARGEGERVFSFSGCRARSRAILAHRSAARIVDRPAPGDLLPLRAFRNDDEGRLPVPASRGVRLERIEGPRAGWHVLGAGQAPRRIDRQRFAVGEMQAPALPVARNVSQAISPSRPLAERSRRASAPIAVTSRTEPLTPMTPRSPSVQRAFVRANSCIRAPTREPQFVLSRRADPSLAARPGPARARARSAAVRGSRRRSPAPRRWSALMVSRYCGLCRCAARRYCQNWATASTASR